MTRMIPGSWVPLLALAGAVACSDATAPVEDELPDPPGPDVGIEITNVNPMSILPGASFEVDYTLLNLSGYVGEAEVIFYLQLGTNFTTLARFDVEFAGSALVLSRELTTPSSMFPGSYAFHGQVDIPNDVDRSNDVFTVEEPFILEAAGGEPHDIGVQITGVSPGQIAPGDTLTFEFTLLNLTEYSGPVTVNFNLGGPSFGRFLLTEEVNMAGEPRDLVREVATPADLQPETYVPIIRVEIENDIDPTNNIAVFGGNVIVATPPE